MNVPRNELHAVAWAEGMPEQMSRDRSNHKEITLQRPLPQPSLRKTSHCGNDRFVSDTMTCSEKGIPGSPL